MIDRKARSTNRNKFIALAAVAVAVIALMAWGRGCRADSLPAPLEGLLSRLQASGTPTWKTALMPRIRERRIGRFTGTITAYCPGRPDIDPPCGGKFAASGVKLRWGHCAVDPRVIPLQSVLVVEGIDHLMLAVDTGGAVRGNHIDIACPEPERYFALAKRFSYARATCWIVRRGA